MKKSVRNGVLIVFLVMTMIVQPISATQVVSKNDNVFVFNVISYDSNVDLSGIVVDVYSASATYTDKNSGCYLYDETYAFSVMTDEKGAVSFSKPSALFSISIRLDTLPDLYGVQEHTKFFADSRILAYKTLLTKIETVDVSFNEEGVTPLLLDNKGSLLSANANVLLGEGNSRAVKVREDPISRELAITYDICVELNGYKHYVDKTLKFSYGSEIEKSQILYNNNFIDKKTYIEDVARSVLFEATSLRSDLFDGTELYWLFKEYFNEPFEKDSSSSLVESALQLYAVPGYENLTGLAISDSGRFYVYYDSESLEVTYAAAKAVANEYDAIDNFFCSTWGFKRPYYESNSSIYYIYIISDLGASGATPLNGTEGSYIKLNSGIVNYVLNGYGSAYPDAINGILAHEYMHGILYRYGIMYDNNDRKWMHESFASWGGLMYTDDYAVLRGEYVSSFLNSSNLSLNVFGTNSGNTYRHYGALLFPLYVSDVMGMAVVRQILSCYVGSYDPMTAIDTGLGIYRSSLEEVYTGCAVYNYEPTQFYSIALASWGHGVRMECQNYPNSPTYGYSIDPLACHYIRCSYPSGLYGEGTLTVTIDYSTPIGTPIPRLKFIRKTAVGQYYIYEQPLGSSTRYTVVQNNFGSASAQEFVVIPVNAGTSGKVIYTRTIALS